LLVCNWPHSVGQNHLFVKMLFNRDSTIQSTFRRICTAFKSEISIPCQTSGRRVIPSGCSSVHCSIRPDDVPYPPDARQTMHHSSGRCGSPFGPFTVLRSFCSSLHSSGRLNNPSGRLSVDQASDSFQSSNMGRSLKPSGRCGIPYGRVSPEGKFAIQTQSSGHQSAMVRTRVLLIWKLHVEDYPSERPSLWSGRAKP